MNTYTTMPLGLKVTFDGDPYRYVFSRLMMTRDLDAEDAYDTMLVFSVHHEAEFKEQGMRAPLTRQHEVRIGINTLVAFLGACVTNPDYAYDCLVADLKKMAGET